MCGITGFFKYKNTNDSFEENRSLLRKMSASITHRGPDQEGFYIGEQNIFLAHQRLSIIDISDAGAQPMESHNKRFTLVYNGEIYNFKELRYELEAKVGQIKWNGHSDTEVLLECIVHYGLEKTLSKLNGMFAFCLYDKRENSLSFARDRFGEKPLYIYTDDNSLAFASELQAIETFTNRLTINQSAVDAQFRYSYIPDPFTIYNEVKKLDAGNFLVIHLENYSKDAVNNYKAYWSVSESIDKGTAQRQQGIDDREAIEQVEFLLKQSISRRMLSDVPLGAFLSGGIDSTCIVALMQDLSPNKVKTFSIGFNDSQYNEANDAKAVSDILGTEHHELYIDASDMLEFIPKLHKIYGEPYADSSQLPTLAVSQFTKKHVTVALTGDSGDEVFCGYNRYSWGQKIISKTNRYPLWARSLLSKSVLSLSPSSYDKLFSLASNIMPKLSGLKTPGDKAHKLAKALNYKDDKDLYSKLIQTWSEKAVKEDFEAIDTDINEAFASSDLSLAEKMMWQDSIGYMKNDILTKVDRASMAFSLETRIPFLDNDLYDFSWQLPLDVKLRNGQTKYPLRSIISKRIPDSIMDRPKAGFGVPIYSWLRNELRDWAEDLLSIESLNESGLLDVKTVRGLWNNHKTEKVNVQYALWNVLMFQQWYLSRFSGK